MTTSITFNTIRTEYGFLSSLYPAPFTLNNTRWRTLEHFIQGMKTDDLERREIIRTAPSASLARSYGDDTALTPVRQDWINPVSTSEGQQIASVIQVSVMTTRDMIMLEGLIAKYRNNPSLANNLRSTAPITLVNTDEDSHWGRGTQQGGFNGQNMLGRLTMYVRDVVLASPVVSGDDSGIIFDNLYSILQGQGYTTVVSIGGQPVNIPLSQAPRTDTKGLRLRGEVTEEETVDVEIEETVDVLEESYNTETGVTISRSTGRTVTRGSGRSRKRKTGNKQQKTIEALVDIYLQGGYSEERLKEVISSMTAPVANTSQRGSSLQQPRRERRNDITYFVVTQLSKQNLNKFLRIAAFNNVRFFSPSELYVTPSKHMLNPPVEKVTVDSPMYEILHAMEGKLPELSSNDKLAKEKGFMPRDIVMVNDFSPHYRIIT